MVTGSLYLGGGGGGGGGYGFSIPGGGGGGGGYVPIVISNDCYSRQEGVGFKG